MKRILIIAFVLCLNINLKGQNYKQTFESTTLLKLKTDSGWASSGVIDFIGSIMTGNKAIITPILSNPLTNVNLKTPLFKGQNTNTFSFDHRVHPSNSSNVRLWIEILDSANNLIKKDSIIYSGASMATKSVSFAYNGSYKINFKWSGSGGASLGYLDNITTNTTFAPLPVKLLNFNTVLTNNKAEVKWQSASEEKFSKYEICRSTDGSRFTSIGQVMPFGNQGEVNSYAFTDFNVANLGVAKVYYKLKMVDMDGSFTWSNVVTVNVNALTATVVNVYPNPATDVLNVDLSSLNGTEFTVSITDINGKLVKQMNSSDLFSGIVSIDLNAFEAGMYVISTITNEGSFTSTKFLKK
ncbi:MAG: T9SS type A sorting domain-containing protein [Bacteroidota bacterium]